MKSTSADLSVSKLHVLHLTPLSPMLLAWIISLLPEICVNCWLTEMAVDSRMLFLRFFLNMRGIKKRSEIISFLLLMFKEE